MKELDIIQCNLLDIENEILELKDIIENLKQERENKKCNWKNLKNYIYSKLWDGGKNILY